MLSIVEIGPGYRTPMQQYSGVEVEPGYRMPMQQSLGADPGLFIDNLWFGDDAAPSKSIMPGVLSIIASAALVGGLLFLIKKA